MKSSNSQSPQQQHNLSYEQIVTQLDKGVPKLDFDGVHFTKDQLNDLAAKVNSNPFVGHIIWGTFPDGAGEIVQQIEDKLVQNNKAYKHYPTDFIHGLLSSHSYKTSIEGSKVEFPKKDSDGKDNVNFKYNQYLTDWRVKKVFQPEKSDDYYSVLYINERDHHAVLAHRGTDIPGSLKNLIPGIGNKSLKADLVEILNHNIGVQQAASYVSTKESLDVLKDDKYSGYNFSTTGHSLGAWLAELSLYFCYMDFEYYSVRAVTFDSPGTKNHLDIYKSNIYNDETKVNKSLLDITTYLSAPNIVNVCNQHIGKVYRIKPEIKYFEVLKKELPIIFPKFVKDIIANNKYYLDSLLSVSGHSLSPMLDVFDPETGKPYPDKYAIVLDWPHIKHMPNTQPIQEILPKILDKIPYVKLIPFKGVIISALNKLIPNTTLGSVSTVIASFLSGDTAISQLCETFKHFNLDTHGNGYELKEELKALEQFALSYEGHYRIKEVNLLQGKLLTENKGTIDWYLSHLEKTDVRVLEKQLDDISYTQLMLVREQYKIEPILGNYYIILNKQPAEQEKLTVEKVKEQLLRLLQVNTTVKDLLEKTAIHSESPDCKIAHNLPERINDFIVSNFIGREEVFTRIDEILSQHQCVVINAWLPGTGKSSTALKYGHREQEKSKNREQEITKIVRWFDSDTSEKLEEGYRQLAQDLDIDRNQDKAVLIHAVKNTIIKSDKPMLFIFDNLEEYRDIEEYSIHLLQAQVKVVITTRDNNLLELKQRIRLEPFDIEIAEKYINTNLPNRTNNKNRKKLIQMLGNKEGDVLPYKLSKAIAYLKKERLCTVEEYIEKYRKNMLDTEYNPDTQIETLLLIQLVKKLPKAWQMLQYAAFLDPDSISIKIFEELLRVDKIILQECVVILEKTSLSDLYYTRSAPFLRIHRLVQEEVKKYIERHPKEVSTIDNIDKDLIISLNNLTPKITKLPNNKWQKAALYHAHVSKILDNSSDILLAERGELYIKCGEYNKYISCNFKKSLVDKKFALEVYEELYQGNHPSVAKSLNRVGIAYHDLGNTVKGLEYFERALVMYQKLYQGNHPFVAKTLNRIGMAYHDLGNAVEGLEYLEKALVMRQELHQGDHPFIAQSLNNVGIVYLALGDAAKGLEYLEKALVMRQNLYQSDHPDVASTLNNVGIVYLALGDAAKGLEYLEKALVMRQNLYQNNHPFVAQSFNNVGVIYLVLGDTSKGLKYFKQAKKMMQELYQSNHSSIASSYNNIGIIYLTLDDATKGLKYFKQAKKMMQELYQSNHPSIASTYNNIGSAHEILDDPIKSLKYKIKALRMYQALYQFDHPDVAILLNNVGIAYEKQGEPKEGLEYQKHALVMIQKLYKSDHPDVASILSNIGISYILSKNITESVKYLERALVMRQVLYRNNYLDPASSINSLGISYQTLLNNISISYQILRIVKKDVEYQDQIPIALYMLYQNSNTDIASSINNLGIAYHELGDKLKAVELFKEAYLIKLKILGSDHLDVKKIEKYISGITPTSTFVTSNKGRISILERGLINEDIIKVKLQIPEKILNKVHELARKGKLNKMRILGAKNCIDKNYLAKILGKESNSEIIEIAQMLCFERICLSIMNSKDKNITCIKEFKKAFPEILAKIIAEHPEYMVDGLIVRECVDDHATLVRLLGEENANFSGQGNAACAERNPWMEYTKEGMGQLLKLKLHSIGREEEEIKTITPNNIWDGLEQTAKTLSEQISINLEDRTLVVLNLFGKHWVGMVIEKTSDSITISYMDSEQIPAPVLLREQLIKQIAVSYPYYSIEFTETTLELQKYNNCGLEVIENLTAYLIGGERTVSQEDALAIHSLLLEDSLITQENILS